MLQMEFHVQGRKITLRGARTPSTKVITNKTLALAINQGVELCFLHVEDVVPQFYIPSCNMTTVGNEIVPIHHDIELLLDSYKDIFVEPK